MSGQGSGGGGALVLLLALWVVAVFIVVGPLSNADASPTASPSVAVSLAPSPTPDLTFGLACATEGDCAAPVTRAEMAAALDIALDVPPSTANPFTDDDGIDQEPAINSLASAGLIGGCDDDRFCPDAGATRAQLAAILVRAFEIPPGEADAFDDDDGTPFEPQINAIAAAGFSGGCGERRFCPDGEVSRQALRDLLARIVRLMP